MTPTRTALATLVLVALPALAVADNDGPVASPPASDAAPEGITAESRYNEGEAFSRSGAWAQAESAYRAATTLRADFTKAWNGLGHALKMQQKFSDALEAYRRALELRPDYPQALEYLGETYVAMGRLDDANATLAKLEPLDAGLATKLRNAIRGDKPSTGW